jgi:hypothetical protein
MPKETYLHAKRDLLTLLPQPTAGRVEAVQVSCDGKMLACMCQRQVVVFRACPPGIPCVCVCVCVCVYVCMILNIMLNI